jgi:diguanylate cyclase (GGDEF)-like protein
MADGERGARRRGETTPLRRRVQRHHQAKESQEKLDHLAHHDPLTALPNRLLFHDRLQHALQRASRDGEQLALMFIDLDRFKNVNDTLGHHIGDELLKQVAKALQERLREGDTLARLGGDEFIVLLEDIENQYGAARWRKS